MKPDVFSVHQNFVSSNFILLCIHSSHSSVYSKKYYLIEIRCSLKFKTPLHYNCRAKLSWNTSILFFVPNAGHFNNSISSNNYDIYLE